MATVIGFVLVALGGYLAYSGFRKFSGALNVFKDGETMNDLMKKDVNQAMKQTRAASLSAVGKGMRIFSGCMLGFIGLVVLFFALQ